MAAQLRVLGIPVRIDVSLVLVLALLGLDLEEPALIAAWVGIGVASVLLHEMGHALMYRRYGQQPSVVLYAFGGVTQGERGLPPARSLAVSLAGPGAQLLLLGLPLTLLAGTDIVQGELSRDVLALGLFINIAWPLFNLLPILPLDGGNVVSSVVELARPGSGLRAAQWVSIVVAAVAGGLAAASGWLFVAAFCGLFAVMNWQAVHRVPAGAATDRILAGYAALLDGDVSGGRLAATDAARQPQLAGAAEELRLWSLVAERDQVRLARALALRPEGAPLSSLLRGCVALLAGRTEEGLGLVAWSLQHEPMGPALALGIDVVAETGQALPLAHLLASLDEGSRAVRLLHAGLHHRGRFAHAAAVGAVLLREPHADPLAREVQADVAVDVAASAARAGDLEQAGAWLTWAVDAGWRDLDRLDGEPDLAPLRDHPAATRLRLAAGPHS